MLAGSSDPEHGNKLKGDRIGQIVDVHRATYNFIILDLGRSLSRISLPLIQQADLIPLIVSTDQSTVKLTKTVWQYLHAQGIGSPTCSGWGAIEGIAIAQPAPPVETPAAPAAGPQAEPTAPSAGGAR